MNDHDKSEIVDGYLNGLTRDEIVARNGSSAGKVSGIINEFVECVNSSSVEAAAEEYDVADSVEKLRSLAVRMRKADANVERLLWLESQLERVKKIVALERLEELVGTAESLDREHLDVAIRLNELEKRTGKSISEIFQQLENSEARNKELESQKQGLETIVNNLKNEAQTLEENLKNQKNRLDAEYEEKLKQHRLRLEEVERVRGLNESLKDFGLELTQLEELNTTLKSFQLVGGNAEQLVDLVRKADALLNQSKTEGEKLIQIREETRKLIQETKQYEKRSRKAQRVIDECKVLLRMGWTLNSLEAVNKLAKTVGDPDQVLKRLELLKPYDDLIAEMNSTKQELQALKQTLVEEIKKTAQTLAQITEKSQIMLNKDLPASVTKTNQLMTGPFNQLIQKYNDLVGRYNELNNNYVKLIESYRVYEKALNEAICWAKFINEPATVSTAEIENLFLTVLFPRLQIWCNSNPKEKRRLATELAKRTIILCNERANTFLNTPKDADLTSAKEAVTSFAFTTLRFHTALREWYDSHQESGSNHLYNEDYYLTKFYETITKRT